MKKLITIIIIGLSFYSCKMEEPNTETITVVFDMQDNIVNYDNEGWIMNLDLETKERVNQVSLQRTNEGFLVRSAYSIYKLEIVTDTHPYQVDYSDTYNVNVSNQNNLDYLFYWHEVIELRLTLLN